MEHVTIKFKIIYLPILLFGVFALAEISFAAPSISNVSGTVSNGQSITISGSGFGTKNPVAPAQWDPVDGMYQAGSISENAYVPMKNGTTVTRCDGQSVQTVPNDPNAPWVASTGSASNPVFTLDNPRGVFTAKYSNERWLADGCMGYEGAVIEGEPYPNAEGGILYISWWGYFWSNDVVGSDKFFRLMNSHISTSGDVMITPIGSAAIWDESNQVFHYSSQYTLTGTSPSAITGQWRRNEVIVDNTGATTIGGSTFGYSPHVYMWIDGAKYYDVQSGVGHWDDAGGPTAGSLPYSVDTIGTLGADWSNDTSQIRYDWGEIYVDTTPARVEICNANTKASSTHCEIQIPKTQWVDEQLEAQVNQGSFSNGSTAYLFVVDSNDTSSSGYQITFGSSGTSDTLAPAAPTGLAVS